VAIVFAVVAVAGLINDLLKIVFGRARPALWLAGDESGFGFFRVGARFASFPSGHTATSVAAALVFGALLPRWRWPFLAAASLIALSRIGVGAHYPSDVVGGAIIGGLVAAALIRQARIRGWMQASAIQESGTGER
jgi:undecaprenyl-diphosphatase